MYRDDTGIQTSYTLQKLQPIRMVISVAHRHPHAFSLKGIAQSKRHVHTLYIYIYVHIQSQGVGKKGKGRDQGKKIRRKEKE